MLNLVFLSGLLLGSIAQGSFLSTLNDDDPIFVYSPPEAWSQSPHPEDLAGESTVTTTVGASVSFSFIGDSDPFFPTLNAQTLLVVGSSFRYVGERFTDQSTSAVTIDGQLYTVDEFVSSSGVEFNVVSHFSPRTRLTQWLKSSRFCWISTHCLLNCIM